MRKIERSVVFRVTIGSFLEWYEMFLYIYWAPIISQLFFVSSSSVFGLIKALMIFAVGFLSRPLGGLFFGYIGDRFGRRTAFIASIFCIIFPTFLIGIIPTYAYFGLMAPILLGVARFLQGIPAGGELPGAMCYLFESAPEERKSFVSSFSFIGPQLGGVVGMIECLLLDKFLTEDFLLSYGWRISFFVGSFFAIAGLFLRWNLKESAPFTHLKEERKVLRRPIRESFLRHKKQMFLAFCVSIFQVVCYFMFAVFPAVYFEEIFSISTSENLIILALLLTVSAVTVPFFGKLGDKFDCRVLLIGSAIAVMLFSIPFYYSIKNSMFLFTIVLEVLFIVPLNIQLALLPAYISRLFPPTVRFTCLGFSFNLSDSLVGGLVPALAIYIIHLTGNLGSFVVIFLISAMISLFALLFSKARREKEPFST